MAIERLLCLSLMRLNETWNKGTGELGGGVGVGCICSGVARMGLGEMDVEDELCEHLANCNNHKSQHLPRTDSIWKEPQKVLTLESELRSQTCRPRPS